MKKNGPGTEGTAHLALSFPQGQVSLGLTRHFCIEKMVCTVGPVLVHFQNKIEQNTNTK